MFSNHCSRYLLLIHEPRDCKIIHVYNNSDLYPVWNLRPAATTIPIFHNGSSFWKITYKLSTPMWVLHISVPLIDDSNWKDFIANPLNVHSEVVFTERRYYLLGEQLITTITIYFRNAVALDSEVIFEVFVKWVYCNLHFLPKCFVLKVW